MKRRVWLAAAFAPTEPLLVAAASDLASLEPDLVQLVSQPVRFSFGSSGMLARQVENGAPFDVFLSADEGLALDLARRGKLLPGQLYATGRLALWSKQPVLRQWTALGAPRFRHLAIANPQHAPYGRAAKQALERAGYWAALASRTVLAENVRQTLQFAESGNADVCLTAWSLVHAKGGTLVEAALHDPIRQVGAVVKASPRQQQAAAFLAALTGASGRALLRSRGFE